MKKKLYSPEETSTRFNSLPEATRELLYSAEMTADVTRVAEKHQLHLDQLDKLNTETAQVMLGFTDMKDFPAIIAEDLSVDLNKANQIAHDISDTLFAKIREAMKAGPAAQPGSAPTSDPIPAAIAPVALAAPLSINKIPEGAPQTAPLPAKATDMHPADMMLTQKTAATPTIAPQSTSPTTAATDPAKKNEPPKPGDYKADPYREPAK